MSDLFNSPLWDKSNPLHAEIMDAAKEAWIERRMRELEADMEARIRMLPWPLRAFIWIRRLWWQFALNLGMTLRRTFEG